MLNGQRSSFLMDAREEGALTRPKELRRGPTDPKIAEHQGACRAIHIVSGGPTQFLNLGMHRRTRSPRPD